MGKEQRSWRKEREREREIPKGFWNGGACGGHTFRVDIACTLATKRSDSITHTSMRMHTHTHKFELNYIYKSQMVKKKTYLSTLALVLGKLVIFPRHKHFWASWVCLKILILAGPFKR